MSSLLLPKMELSRSHALLAILMLLIVNFVLDNFHYQPDFSQTNVVFGMVLITLLITSIISYSSFISWLDAKLCGISKKDQFISEDYNVLKSSEEFHTLMDKDTSELLMSFNLFILALTFLYFGNQLIVSFFGSSILKNIGDLTITSQIIITLNTSYSILALIMIIIGLILFIDANKKGRKKFSSAFNLLFYFRFRKQDRNDYISEKISKLSPLIREFQWNELEDELHSDIYVDIKNQLLSFQNELKKLLLKIRDREISDDWGFNSDYFINLSTIESSLTFNETIFNYGSNDRLPFERGLKLKRDSIRIYNLLFSRNNSSASQEYEIEKYTNTIYILDYLIVLFTRYVTFLRVIGTGEPLFNLTNNNITKDLIWNNEKQLNDYSYAIAKYVINFIKDPNIKNKKIKVVNSSSLVINPETIVSILDGDLGKENLSTLIRNSNQQGIINSFDNTCKIILKDWYESKKFKHLSLEFDSLGSIILKEGYLSIIKEILRQREQFIKEFFKNNKSQLAFINLILTKLPWEHNHTFSFWK